MELDQACAVIERDRADAERESRMTSAVREAATAANLWALAAPREVGGEEQTLVELARTFERLGHADPAFSWIAMNSLTLAHTSAKLPAAVRDEVYSIRDAPCGLSGAITYTTARRVDGGLRIDGDWRFVTGSADARWMIANTLIDDETELGVHGVVIPMTDTIVSDTWRDASSMRGTGSNAVRASDLFVPDERVVAPTAPLLLDRPLYRAANLVVLWAPCVSLVIGALRSAIDGTVELVANKRSSGSPARMMHADTWRVQQAVADATAAADCLMSGLVAILEELWSCAEAGEKPSLLLRARWWSLLSASMDVARHHVSELYSRSSSAVYAGANRVERALRDIHAIATTFEQAPVQTLRADAARVLFGGEPKNPMF